MRSFPLVIKLDGCPICKAVFTHRGDIGSTCLSFGAPEGHEHDDNTHSAMFLCANGHRGYLAKLNQCPFPGCGWWGGESSWCITVPEWPPLRHNADCSIDHDAEDALGFSMEIPPDKPWLIPTGYLKHMSGGRRENDF
jgi:hypothetical protein